MNNMYGMPVGSSDTAKPTDHKPHIFRYRVYRRHIRGCAATQSKQDLQLTFTLSGESVAHHVTMHYCQVFLKPFCLARLDCGSKPHDVLSFCC